MPLHELGYLCSDRPSLRENRDVLASLNSRELGMRHTSLEHLRLHVKRQVRVFGTMDNQNGHLGFSGG